MDHAPGKNQTLELNRTPGLVQQAHQQGEEILKGMYQAGCKLVNYQG